MAKDTCTEYLRYEFSQDEVREMGKELARKNNQVMEAQAQKKAVMSQLEEQEERATSEITTLSRQVSNGYEYRNIDCTIQFHTPRVGMCTVIRLDTGEVVKERAMNTQEQQECLPFIEEEPVDRQSAAAND